MSLAERTLVVPQEFDLDLPSGRIHAERFGREGAPLVLCLPGLSVNMKCFDYFGERLGGDDLQVVSYDMRGRGKSEATPPGTYGWSRHAADAIAIADALGAKTFSLVGLSSGGWKSMVAARQAPGRVDKLVLIDICGRPQKSAAAPIWMGIGRLGAVYPSVDAAIALVQQLGHIQPWSEYWERIYRYELVPTDGGVVSRTNQLAVFEDAGYGKGQCAFGDDAAVYNLWRSLQMPVLLLRAKNDFLPGFGSICPERERDRFLREVPTARCVEVDANHYTISMHPDALDATAEFLGVAR